MLYMCVYCMCRGVVSVIYLYSVVSVIYLV